MGIFDSIKKIFDNVGNGESISESQKNNESVQTDSNCSENPHSDTEMLNSANVAAKPSVLYKDEYGDKTYSFMISSDFIEFDSGCCEVNPAFQYEPSADKEYTEYDESLPNISISDNEFHDVAYEYQKNGILPDENYEKCQSKYFLFKVNTELNGKQIYGYAFAGNTAREYEMLMLEYSADVKDTALEKKLMSILDEAASTYAED